jgi:predicted RNase H-like nuclease (RuvC/YqgF family)
MEDLKNIIQKLTEEVKEIRKENHKYHEILGKLAEENKEIKRENNEMKNKMQYMEDKLEQMERHQKKNSIVIFGMELKKEKNETPEKKLEKWIKNNREINVEIESVYKINNKMYVGEVSKYEKKIEIMKKKSCLRETENKRIFITNDLTKKERDIQGWNKVRIGYKKLTINEKIWTWNSKTHQTEE